MHTQCTLTHLHATTLKTNDYFHINFNFNIKFSFFFVSRLRLRAPHIHSEIHSFIHSLNHCNLEWKGDWMEWWLRPFIICTSTLQDTYLVVYTIQNTEVPIPSLCFPFHSFPFLYSLWEEWQKQRRNKQTQTKTKTQTQTQKLCMTALA